MAEQNRSHRLDGVKAIADYLDISVRNVYRWKKIGLPLHHVAGHKGSRVFAFAEELDTWMSKKKDSVADKKFKRRFLILAIVLFLTVFMASSYLIFGLNQNHVSRSSLANDIDPTMAVLKDNLVLIKNAGGEILWSCLASRDEFNDYMRKKYRLADFKDLDSDGLNEVIGCRFDPHNQDYYLALFDTNGIQKWEKTIDVTEAVFSGLGLHTKYRPINIRFYETTDGSIEILSLWNHQIRFPSVVVAFDLSGNQLRQYLNVGQSNSLDVIDFDEDGNKEIIITGTNNLLAGEGYICILSAEDFEGMSPPYTIEPEYMEERNRLSLYLPDNPVVGNQIAYIRFKRLDYSVEYERAYQLCNYNNHSDNITYISFFPWNHKKNGNLMEVGFQCLFHNDFSLKYIFPNAELLEAFNDGILEKESGVSLDNVIEAYSKSIYRWQKDGTWVPVRQPMGRNERKQRSH